MPFDRQTRNSLSNVVVQCRRLLINEVKDQLAQTFGIQPGGQVVPLDRLTHLDERQRESAAALRELLAHYAAVAPGGEGEKRSTAYDRTVLEIAFSILNRLAALRICEERDLIVEAVRRGAASDGAQVFERLANGALGDRHATYLTFLGLLFDELAVDLPVLFDRTTPQSSIFPRERCLEEVLGLLDNPELAPLWREDETIGWIYQYFNPADERRAMRDASSAPRNGRELAVRNQFFTPRYVVEFLVDNALGRIWYEMLQGKTALAEACTLMVRKPGEEIPPRAKKDPREIRMLDPAGGSGHFALYCFDLFETIYRGGVGRRGSRAVPAAGFRRPRGLPARGPSSHPRAQPPPHRHRPAPLPDRLARALAAGAAVLAGHGCQGGGTAPDPQGKRRLRRADARRGGAARGVRIGAPAAAARPARARGLHQDEARGRGGLAAEDREGARGRNRSGTAPVVAGHRAGAARALPRAPGRGKGSNLASSTPPVSRTRSSGSRSKRSCSRH